MKPLSIRFYHGTPSACQFLNKVKKLCRETPDGNLFYDGTLEEWRYGWRDKFLYVPPTESQKPFVSGIVWVTPYANFQAGSDFYPILIE